MTAGMIFAASIISGRALQPLDQIVGSWRQIVEASQAWKRISAMAKLDSIEKPVSVELPAPKGALSLEQIVYFLPNADPGAPPLIERISFAVDPTSTSGGAQTLFSTKPLPMRLLRICLHGERIGS